MRKVDPKALGDFIKAFLNQGDYRRLIGQRFFRATIASVTQQSWAGYLVTVIRVGESAPDGGLYQCNVPGYVPAVGDDVDMEWRDESNAMVVAPITAGHMQLPTVAAVAGMSAIAITALSTDLEGEVIYTPSGAVGAGSVLFTVTFKKPFPTTPFVIACAARGQADGIISPYSGGTTLTQLQIAALGAHTGGVQYTCHYWIPR